jgi:transcriptional regulator with XRE-family HTH domain
MHLEGVPDTWLMSDGRHTHEMDDHRVGAALKAIRIRKGWRQTDLAANAGVSATIIVRIERGRLDSIPVGVLRRVATALDARLDTYIRWQGGDLGRLINARHSAMHEAMARSFTSHPDWAAEPEVSYSVFGERGVIDILAWNPTRQSLLVVELKTQLVDINDLMGSMNRKRRLAVVIARDRDWHPLATSTWVVIADSSTNRRALAGHAAVLRAKFPVDGRGIRRWLAQPFGRVDALGFLPPVHALNVRKDLAPIRRVSRARSACRRA